MGINNVGNALCTLPLKEGGSFSRCFLRMGVRVAGGSREKSNGNSEEAPTWKDQAHQWPPGGPHPSTCTRSLMNLYLACLSLLCLPSASCKAREMIDNPGWGCLERMFWFVTLILAAPVNNLLEARVGRGHSALYLDLLPKALGPWAVKSQPQTPGRHSSDLIFSYQA